MSCPEMGPRALRQVTRGDLQPLRRPGVRPASGELIGGCYVLDGLSLARTGSRCKGTVVGSGQRHEASDHPSLISLRCYRVQAVGREA